MVETDSYKFANLSWHAHLQKCPDISSERDNINEVPTRLVKMCLKAFAWLGGILGAALGVVIGNQLLVERSTLVLLGISFALALSACECIVGGALSIILHNVHSDDRANKSIKAFVVLGMVLGGCAGWLLGTSLSQISVIVALPVLILVPICGLMEGYVGCALGAVMFTSRFETTHIFSGVVGLVIFTLFGLITKGWYFNEWVGELLFVVVCAHVGGIAGVITKEIDL